MERLASGANRSWDDVRVTAYVTGARVRALLLDEGGRALADAPWVEGAAREGVEHLPGSPEGVSALLASIAPRVERFLVVATDFSTPPTAQLLAADGTVLYDVAPAQLTVERALVMVEVYRRQGAWKVRALAQGYAGGLDELARVYGATSPAAPAAAPPPPPPPAATATPTSPGPMIEQDPVRRIGMILDDASRTTASFLSSAAYAEQRLEQEVEQILGDPALRMGPAGDAARAAAARRRDDLVAQARERHAADLTQLTAELDSLADTLPAALAPWHAAAWNGRLAEGEAPYAFRLGELSLESAPLFRLPMVRVLPLGPPVWIETDEGGDHDVGRMLAAIATRLMVAMRLPPRLAVIDVGGRARVPMLPLSAPLATDPYAASDILREHVDHLGLVEAAFQAGSLDDLPAQHRPGRVLMIADFPGGLDDSSVGLVHRLVQYGPACGVNVVLSGRRPQSLGIPILDVIHESCLRVPTAPGGDLVDAYGGVTWVFHPDLGADDPGVRQRVQATVDQHAALRDRS